MGHHFKPGICPLCGFRIPPPDAFVGTWIGAKANGRPAAGVICHSRCRLCRAALVAFIDSYDDFGNVIASPESGAEPDPVWSVRGVPWQTIGLAALTIVMAIWCIQRVKVG